MSILEIDIINRLDKEVKEKITYFINLIIQHSKYRKLKEEIRRGEVLTHEEMWNKINV